MCVHSAQLSLPLCGIWHRKRLEETYDEHLYPRGTSLKLRRNSDFVDENFNTLDWYMWHEEVLKQFYVPGINDEALGKTRIPE
jgi:hypothetical protein